MTMDLDLALGTTSGVHFFQGEPGIWKLNFSSLQGEVISVVRFHPNLTGTVFAGSYGNGLFVSEDGGNHWEKRDVGADHLRIIAFDPREDDIIYAGTEPAELFRSTDRGATWTSLGLRNLDSAASWSLPYSPRAGALRTLLLPEKTPGLIYAGIEQGGFARSTDGGSNWTLIDKGMHIDIHWLDSPVDNPAIIFAATGGGLFRSEDSGGQWTRLRSEYVRAIGLHPIARPNKVFAGPARGVGKGGDLVVGSFHGDSWDRKLEGMGSYPLDDMIEMFYLFTKLPDHAFALRDNGKLYEACPSDWYWHQIACDLPEIQTMSLG